jgi:hypothetical protein
LKGCFDRDELSIFRQIHVDRSHQQMERFADIDGDSSQNLNRVF